MRGWTENDTEGFGSKIIPELNSHCSTGRAHFACRLLAGIGDKLDPLKLAGCMPSQWKLSCFLLNRVAVTTVSEGTTQYNPTMSSKVHFLWLGWHYSNRHWSVSHKDTWAGSIRLVLEQLPGHMDDVVYLLVSRGRNNHCQDFPVMSAPLIHSMTTVTMSF